MALAQAEDGWGAYQPRTLDQIIKQHSRTVADTQARVDLFFTAELFPSRVKVTYTGQIRKIAATRKEFIARWATTRNAQQLSALFEEELLFKEGAVDYWLPVQKQVIPYFKEELKPGDPVELLLIWIGARSESKVADWIFLVNEFEQHEPADKLDGGWSMKPSNRASSTGGV